MQMARGNSLLIFADVIPVAQDKKDLKKTPLILLMIKGHQMM